MRIAEYGLSYVTYIVESFRRYAVQNTLMGFRSRMRLR